MTRLTPILRFAASMPLIQSRAGLFVALCFFFVVTGEVFFVGIAGLFLIAVMRLVIEHHDVFHTHQVRHDTLEHLPFAFERVDGVTMTTFQKGSVAFGKFEPLSELESVIVGDDDFGALYVVEHVRRYQLAAGVVAFGVTRLEHAKPILDSESRCDNEEAASEV
jgi:hypothetical protein